MNEPQIEVWIANIRHKYGTDTYAARTEEKLNKLIYGYVKQWWNNIEWNKGDKDIKLPKDHNKAIAIYFEKMAEEYLDVMQKEI